MLERILIGAIGLAGLLISILFCLTAWSTRTGRPYDEIGKTILRFCRFGEGECRDILSTPDAKLFGVPNYYTGILFYAFVLAAVFLPGADEPGMLLWALIGFTTVAVMIGAYLVFSLMFQLRMKCPLCYASHALNFLLLAILIIMII